MDDRLSLLLKQLNRLSNECPELNFKTRFYVIFGDVPTKKLLKSILCDATYHGFETSEIINGYLELE